MRTKATRECCQPMKKPQQNKTKSRLSKIALNSFPVALCFMGSYTSGVPQQKTLADEGWLDPTISIHEKNGWVKTAGVTLLGRSPVEHRQSVLLRSPHSGGSWAIGVFSWSVGETDGFCLDAYCLENSTVAWDIKITQHFAVGADCMGLYLRFICSEAGLPGRGWKLRMVFSLETGAMSTLITTCLI